MTFAHDYDLDALELVQVLGQQFRMHVTPRFRDRYQNAEYEAYTARLLAKMCERAQVFVDVGAHYGFFSLLAASRYPKLRVIAAEPSRINFDVLERNVSINGFANVERLNVAISSCDGDADFLISEASDNCSFYPHPSAGSGGTERVRTTTIDRLLGAAKPGPVVIKIDTDGHEFEVLDGMLRTLEHSPDVALFVEFNPKMIEVAHKKPADLIRRLETLGFAIFLLDDVRQHHFRISSETDWTTFFDPKSYVNLVCLPKAHAVNVLFFSHLATLGGAERSLLELVDEWMTDHWVLATIVCPNEGDLTIAARAIGAAVLVLPFDWWCHSGQPPDDIKALMAQNLQLLARHLPTLRRMDPDLVWTQSIVMPWGALAAAFLRKPHIWSVCEYGERDHQLHFYLPFADVLRLVDLSSNFVYANSPSLLREMFPELRPERAGFLYRHIPIPDRKAIKPSDALWTTNRRPRIAVVGTLQEGKGQEDAVRAVGALASRGRKVELLLAGSANEAYMARLQSVARELGIATQITFTGFINDPFPTIATADIIVSCARHEAFGRSVAEAMLLERAVVYANAGGPADHMIDGKTGLSYLPGDIDRLVDRLDTLIARPTLRRQLGRQARRHAERTFSRAQFGEKAFKTAIELVHQPAHFLSVRSNTPQIFFSAVESLTALLLSGLLEPPPSQSRIAEFESAVALSTAKARSLEAASADLQHRVETLEGQLVTAHSHIGELEHGVWVWSAEARKLETDRGALLQRVPELESHLQSSQHRIAELESAVEVWSTEARKLDADRGALLERVPEMEGRLLSSRHRIAELENSVEVWSTEARKLDADRGALLERVPEMEGRLLSSRHRIAELENSVDVWSTEARKLEADRGALLERVPELEGRLLSAQSRVAELNHRIEESVTQVRQLELDLNAAQARARHREAELASQGERVVAAEGRGRQLEQELQFQCAALAELLRRTDAANRELTRVFASCSWRFTKPLRVAAHISRRLYVAIQYRVSGRNEAK